MSSIVESINNSSRYYAVVQLVDPTMQNEGWNENKMTQRDLVHRSDRDNFGAAITLDHHTLKGKTL